MRHDGWFRAASHFHLDPIAISTLWSERQLETVLAWMDVDLARPSRADNYAMQVASGVDQVLHQLRASAGAKGERPRPFESFVLAFGPPKGAEPVAQEESSGWPKGLRRMTKEDIMRADQNARRQSIEARTKVGDKPAAKVTGPIPSPRRR